jgi:hypothetical protein
MLSTDSRFQLIRPACVFARGMCARTTRRRPLDRHRGSTTRQVARNRPTTASHTVAHFARYGADLQHWRMIAARHMPAQSHRGGTRAE